MKRLTMILAMLILLAGLVPMALAQEAAGPTPMLLPNTAATSAVQAPQAPDAVLYFWDFEGNNGGFASTLDWEWGTYAWVGNGCYNANNTPPPAPYSGTDMWGSVLNTCYSDLGNNADPCANANPNDDSILSFSIDLTGATAPITMTWWEWYDLFGSWDWAEVYANGSVVWQNCSSHVVPTAWVQQAVDLSPYAGGPVTIEFHMMASSVVNYAGWYIDDVMIADAFQPPIVWDKTIDGEPWVAGMEITRQTSDTIVVEEVLHLTPPPPPPGPTTAPMDWQPNLPVAPTLPDRTPETVGGTPPPAQALPAAAPRPLQAGGLLYLTSLDIGDATFAVYDPASDAWTTLTPYETGCQMAVGAAGQLYAYNHTAGTIDLYDPATDTWTPVLPAPPGASGQYCNLEITNAGEFLYTQFSGTMLWYTAGGVWNTLALTFTTNVMGDYDPTADQYVIGEAWTTNAHLIDVHTWAITDFTSGIGNGEYARSGVVMGNRYYFEAGGSNIHSFDLGSPGFPPYDHGVSSGYYTSAAGDRANAVVYNASLNATELNYFDPATNMLTPLTGYSGGMANHSSLAFVPTPPVYAQVETWDPAYLQLLDWQATGGDVISMTGQLVWTGPLLEPATITLTKWFHVEPCTWTQTILWEELWLDDTELEQRPVVVNKLPPGLWIDSTYDPIVCPGLPAQFVLGYGNLGGYENLVMVRNEFPPEAPFAFSEPPPDNLDPAGLWAEWLVGDLAQGAEGYITVTVAVTDTALPGDLPAIYDWIIDHVGEPRDVTDIVFTVGAPDIAVDPPALWAELCPDEMTMIDLAVCNDGDCLLTWALSEMTPTTWLSADPTTGTVPPATCALVTVTLDAAGLIPDDYFAALVIDSDDPDEPQVTVPVTLTVLQPAEILTVTTAITDLTVAFTAEVTGTPPIDYLWDFGDGSFATETHPIHTYATAGCYSVSLDVANACGLDSWIGEVCLGECIPPAGADFSWAPNQPIMGEVVHFTGTVAAGTAPLTYAWAFGDGETGSGTHPTHVYAMAGTYTVLMTVTNECGEDYATYDITVLEGCVAPTGADFAWLPLNPGAGQVVAFSGSTAGGTPPITYAWAFGDGGMGAGSPINHTYIMTGTYTVVMTATNACGFDVATHDVVVSGVAPMSYIYLPLVVRP